MIFPPSTKMQQSGSNFMGGHLPKPPAAVKAWDLPFVPCNVFFAHAFLHRSALQEGRELLRIYSFGDKESSTMHCDDHVSTVKWMRQQLHCTDCTFLHWIFILQHCTLVDCSASAWPCPGPETWTSQWRLTIYQSVNILYWHSILRIFRGSKLEEQKFKQRIVV